MSESNGSHPDIWGQPRIGDWIQTRSGVQFHPFDARPEDFRIEDIAHALSYCCRFAGHVSEFYSVAEHSVRVSSLIQHWGDPAEVQLAGLLHDAAEAYIGDFPRPLKQMPAFASYLALDSELSAKVAAKFGLSFPWHPSVRRADEALLGTEARDLMSPVLKDWNRHLEQLPDRIQPWSSDLAESRFMRRFRHLADVANIPEEARA